MKTICEVMDMLTRLKRESVADADVFGRSQADLQIKAIAATLEVFGVDWAYRLNADDCWVAVLKSLPDDG